MKHIYIATVAAGLLLLVLTLAGAQPALAQSPADWLIFVGVQRGSLGTGMGVMSWGSDSVPGGAPPIVPPANWRGVFVLEYLTQGWQGDNPSGLFDGSIWQTPIQPGTSKTWSSFYLWAQNFTPTSANLGRIAPQFGTEYVPPAGYRAHLVLDYVPASCNWGGPMDIWINDLTADNTFPMPIPVVTDPLQGTQFHIDVYAPVPEPSSLATLICGLVGAGGVVLRRRRHAR